MTYQFTRKPRAVWWPVIIKRPRDDGVDEIKIRVQFLLPKRSVARAPGFGSEKAAEYVLDWEGVIDADSGQPLPFNAENLAALRDDAYFENALALGLAHAANGAIEKN